MDSKKIRKSISGFVGWVGLSLCSLIIRVIPGSLVYPLARHIAFLAYSLVRKKRRIALESLSIAFGEEKTEDEIVRIAKECFVYMAKGGVELIYLTDRPHLLKKCVQIIGKDNLDAALARGKGVILISAHFGNFPLMLARLGLEGYKVAGIMRPMRNNRVEKLFSVKRRRFNVKTIYSQPRKACIESTIKAIRDNELVFVLLDQNFGTGGVFVDFFGRKAATAIGPLVLAKRTKAAIIPCFIVRQRDDAHKIIIEPPFVQEEKGTYQENLTANIQGLTNIIEAYIRKYPEQWGWIHRRWKSRPNLERGGA
jgi:KDO2-lipid IV(A) lauroyltransferase